MAVSQTTPSTNAMSEQEKSQINTKLSEIYGIAQVSGDRTEDWPFEARVKLFKIQYWTDAKISNGYMNAEHLKGVEGIQHLATEVAKKMSMKEESRPLEVTDLNDAQKKTLLDAVNTLNKTDFKVEDLDKAIIFDKQKNWTDERIVPDKAGSYLNSSVVKKMDEVIASQKDLGRAILPTHIVVPVKLTKESALDAFHEKIVQLKKAIEAGTASSNDYESAEAARKAARSFFEKEQDPTKAFTNAYAARFSNEKNAVGLAKETWGKRSMAFAQDMRSEYFDAAKVAAIIDADSNGVISPAERNTISLLADRAMSNISDESYDSSKVSVNKGRVKLEQAIEAFKKTGTYGGEDVQVAPTDVTPQANNSGNRRPADKTPTQ